MTSKEIYKQVIFWILNVGLQVILIPVIVSLLCISSSKYWASLILAGLMMVVSGALACRQISWFNKNTEEIKEGIDTEQVFEKLKRYIKWMFISCLPIIGLFSAIPAAKAYCITDTFREKTGISLKGWTQQNDRLLTFLGVTHASNVILGMLEWFLLGFIQDHNVLIAVYAIAALAVTYGLLTLLINLVLIKHNLTSLIYIRNLNEDTSKKTRIWKKSVKWNFLTYIPLLGIFALIPFFIIRETNKDLKDENHDYEKQYLYKCRFFVWVLIIGSVISLPYLIAFASLGWWQPTKVWLSTPLIVWTVTSLSINFSLSFEKSIYSEMYLLESKHYPQISELNNISKIIAGMSILSLPAILPSVIVFLRKLRKYNKNIEIVN